MRRQREAVVLALRLLMLATIAGPSAGLLASADTAENCIWGICSVVIVRHNTLEPRESRSLVLHRCDPSTRHPEKCMVSEVVTEPEGVSNFTMRRANLRDVDVRGFCLFERLSGLDLSENLIERFDFPTSMQPHCLAHLRWFSLRGNRLRAVDIAQFTRFPTLEKVDLSENGLLETLHISELMPHTRLSAIMAQKCRIKQLDISLVRLPSLQDVDLNYNQLSGLTNRLNWSWTVREVRAIEEERNRRKTRDPYYYARLSIQMVQNQFGPEAFGRNRLWGLPMPDLDATDSTSPDDAVVNELKRYRDAFQSFVYLDHVGSSVTCDCHLFHAWQYLRRVYADPREFSKRNALSIADWVSLPCDSAGFGRGMTGRPQSIAYLSADDLACTHLAGCPPGCNCTELVSPSLLTVDCRGRGLRAMPDSLPASVHPVRYALLLGGNLISELRALPPRQAQLVQQLDLSNNLLSSFTDFSPLAAFPNVHSVNLSGNWQLTELPPSLLNNATSRLPSSLLHLSVGQLTCRCGLLESEAVVPMRWLLADYRQLRCRPGAEDSSAAAVYQPRQLVGVGGLDDNAMFLAEFHQQFCLRLPQVNSTPVVIYQQPANHASSNAVLFIIVALVAAVLILLTVALVCVFTCRRRHRASNQQQHQQPQPQQRQSQQMQQQQQPCSTSISPYDVANPSIRYVSCGIGERIDSAEPAQLKPGPGGSNISLALLSSPQQRRHDPSTIYISQLPAAVSHGVNDDADSSDFSSGDLSDSESAPRAPVGVPGAADIYQRLPHARTPLLSVELPPPLPPRPMPLGGAIYQQQPSQQRLAAMTLYAQTERRDSGTNV